MSNIQESVSTRKKIMGNQQGFTLVEIAIVLVVIGLLLAGVMKGTALIQQAKVKNVIQQVDSFRVASLTFFDRFGQLAGDENLQNIPAGDDNAIGDGNGQITGTEINDFFNDLMEAGIISGNYDGTTATRPRHAFGDTLILFWGVPGVTPTPSRDHWFQLDNLPWDVALEIDMKLDDGVHDTGSVVANEAYIPASNNIGRLYIKY